MKRKTFVFRKVMDCSTEHITKADSLLLSKAAGWGGTIPTPLLVTEYPEGFFVYCGWDSAEMKSALAGASQAGFSSDLLDILKQGNKADCAYVQFDADGATYQQFKDFKW